MFQFIIKKVIGSKNERYIKKLNPLVTKINGHEEQMRALRDDDFPVKIREWKEQVANGRLLDDLLPETFALVREASWRALQMRHFDAQLIGGVVLHHGKIAEMKTGEGKTLAATLPVVLNALAGKGVHVVTVNDYLARRDSEWMGQIYRFLGLDVGVILHGLTDPERQASYNADVTYGTNNEFGFDYLRDNMKFHIQHLVQRDLFFAIVDEVDSILIDEARTPLIISGPAEDSTGLYVQINALIPKLQKERDFTVDEKVRAILLTEEGVGRCEELLGLENLYDPKNIRFQHHILQALKAHHIFKRDVDYIVNEGQVVIVDEFTGRTMPGRRYSDGLHQALEAKEFVKIQAENQTLASITFQNYFRMYDKLAGMTGTADTEAVEFKEIYNLDVSAVPTHRPMVREDHPDMIYKSQDDKYKAIAQDIHDLHVKGQPVLVGTVSIEKSEIVSKLLKRHDVPHSVLNAKNHEKEAEIVASAGHRGQVTIATNMAGRGTDIVLGEGVVDLGGLHIIGTERHESRRIDNQLRGRSGRQGDPGSSRFYLALDDDLLRLFGSDKIAGLMGRLGLEEGEAIENRMVSRAIENAQRKVEAHNFEIRKQLLDFDNVMNQQREVIYTQRREIMANKELEEMVEAFVEDLVEDIYTPLKSKEPDEEARQEVRGRLGEVFGLGRVHPLPDDKLPNEDGAVEQVNAVLERLKADAGHHYQEILRYFLLDSLDRDWKEHLLNMDGLREGIGLRGYGQKDPKQEYKREGFELFQTMLHLIKEHTLRNLCHLKLNIVREEQFQHEEKPQRLQYSGAEKEAAPAKQPVRRDQPKVGRNDPCPCGSGRKHKKCCGAAG
ncbi:preprotein translocase subunit SecA [Desulfonatronum thiosulfatophilum]|uniref:Protein translocase subunit SecA n=1 Tax=Desulfonatronum thiosulfatophilum TaxID=617002 RepID=A0A1G6AL87_9BACT|nr:preprotein translocase subunit SecA [Desulfonatronum thiosulfatophilum]SDB09070.1 preprotein translocase subunit SecA [Desulfonatronum thiosulfatophilum]